MFLARQELQREDLLELTSIELDRRCPIETIQRHAILEAGLQQMPFECLLVAALDLVSEQKGEERHVIQLLGARERQPLRQGGQQRTELEAFEQAHQIGIDHAHG